MFGFPYPCMGRELTIKQSLGEKEYVFLRMFRKEIPVPKILYRL